MMVKDRLDHLGNSAKGKVEEPSAKPRGNPMVKGRIEEDIAKESEKVPSERLLGNQRVVIAQ